MAAMEGMEGMEAVAQGVPLSEFSLAVHQYPIPKSHATHLYWVCEFILLCFLEGSNFF